MASGSLHSDYRKLIKKKRKKSRKWPKRPKNLYFDRFGPFLYRRSAAATSSREAWAASEFKKNKKKHRILRDLEGVF